MCVCVCVKFIRFFSQFITIYMARYTLYPRVFIIVNDVYDGEIQTLWTPYPWLHPCSRSPGRAVLARKRLLIGNHSTPEHSALYTLRVTYRGRTDASQSRPAYRTPDDPYRPRSWKSTLRPRDTSIRQSSILRVYSLSQPYSTYLFWSIRRSESKKQNSKVDLT